MWLILFMPKVQPITHTRNATKPWHGSCTMHYSRALAWILSRMASNQGKLVDQAWTHNRWHLHDVSDTRSGLHPYCWKDSPLVPCGTLSAFLQRQDRFLHNAFPTWKLTPPYKFVHSTTYPKYRGTACMSAWSCRVIFPRFLRRHCGKS